MKHALILLILTSVLIAPGSASTDELSLSVSADTSSLRSLFTPSLYLGGTIAASFGEIGFSIPFTCIRDGSGGDEQLLDTGLHLEIFPFSKGLFYSVSLIQMVFFFGPYIPEHRVHTMNEISVGYEISLPGGFSLVPRLRARDLSNTFTEELEYIRGFIPGYTKVDIALELRYTAVSFDLDSHMYEEECR